MKLKNSQTYYQKKEEFLEQNKKLLADISDKEKEKSALANENKIKISKLESLDLKISSLQSELLEANMSNNKQDQEDLV